jgi:Second Messenger Oligonucleotide or Dinucleotide Synthetase domain
MANCEPQLWGLVSQIEPTQYQKEGAVRSHNYLRDILCTGQMGTRIVDHYLSGSYSRDTAIRPLDDVDIIFVIDPAKWDGGFFGYPPPEKVLNTFASAIRYRYPVSSVHGQRRSVGLKLSHLDIDVVPAINADKTGDYIYIPDRNSGEWIKSSPKRHSANATTANKLNNGKFKPLVKLLKFWNGNLPSTASLKSFSIETLATRIFLNVRFTSLEEGLLLFFDFISKYSDSPTTYRWQNNYDISLNWISTQIPDAAGTGSNLAAGVDSDRRSKFIQNSVRSRDKMLMARSAMTVETACRRVREALKA